MLKDLRNNTKWSNTHITGIQEWGESECDKNIYKEIMSPVFLNLVKDLRTWKLSKLQVKAIQRKFHLGPPNANYWNYKIKKKPWKQLEYITLKGATTLATTDIVRSTGNQKTVEWHL